MTAPRTGRTRLGRFAAITIPGAAASAVLGFAVLQGMASASLSAAEPFELGSGEITATSLQLNLDAASAAASSTNVNETKKKAARADLTGANLDGLCLAAAHNLPVLGDVIGLKIESPGKVNLGDLSMKADALDASKAKLPATTVGVASTWDDDTKGGFGMKSKGDVSLKEVNGKAYALELSSLTVSDLAISPQLGRPSCS